MTTAGAIRAGRALVEIGTNLAPLERGLKAAQAQLQQFGNTTNAIGRTTTLAGAAVSGALFIPIKLAANMEATTQQFETMLGSAQRARQLVDDLTDMAARTPMTTTDLVDASRTLLQFGLHVDDLLPTLRMLGDVTGGNAERFGRMALAYGQSTAAGRLMGQDLLQMVNAGFNPLQAITARTGETMQQLRKRMEDGGISSQELALAFHDATAEGGRFNNLMEKQSKTTLGRWSTLLDSIQLALIPIGNVFLPAINAGLAWMAAAINSVSGAIQPMLPLLWAVAITGGGLLAAGSAMLAFSVASRLAAFAIGTLLQGLVMTRMALAWLISPAALTVAAVVAIAAAITYATGNGGAALDWLRDRFGRLADIAGETAGGVASALTRGDIPAAANLLWLGLKAAWTDGTADLQNIWLDFKHGFVATWFAAENAIRRGMANIRATWATLKNGLDTGARSWGESAFRTYKEAEIGLRMQAGAITPEQAAREYSVLSVSTNAGQKSIATDSAAEQSRIDAELAAAMATIDADAAAQTDANQMAYQTAQQQIAAEIAAARANLQAALQEEKKAATATDTAAPEAGKFDFDPQKLATMMQASTANALEKQTAAAAGGFSVAAAFGFGADSLATRTATATEQTARNTQQLVPLIAQSLMLGS